MKTKLTISILFLLLFVSFTANSQVPARVGWWKFDDAADLLKAEIGAPLSLVGAQLSIDGPGVGNKATQIDLGSYLSMTHGIAANGGGTKVNEYSIQIDFSVPAVGAWHAFFQTDETGDPVNDAELFTNTSNSIGVGGPGYSSKVISADTWYRMVITVKNGEFFKVYVNGAPWLSAAGQTIDERFALGTTLLMFADNDGEDGLINCAEIGIWDFALDMDQITQLGDAQGDRVRVRTKLGTWTFDDPSNLLKADIGSDLQLVGTQESVAGPAEGNLATKIGVGSYLKMVHGIALKGEDTLVNEYSLQIDFSAPAVDIWHAFFQTEPANTGDADLFTNVADNTIGTSTTDYSENSISANTWYRMVITVKNDELFKVYLNGALWLDALGQPVDGRWGLSKLLLLFADNDGEDGELICSEVNLWEVALTENEVISLGTDPSGVIPERVGWWRFDDLLSPLSATIGTSLEASGSTATADGPEAGNGAVQDEAGDWLIMDHGIAANGGGTLVNEYSLQIDFSVPEISIWHAFMQTDPGGAKVGDGDLFIHGTNNNIGTATTGYTGTAIEAGIWYRMIVVVKNGSFFRIYVNGELWHDAAGQAVDGRFALSSQLFLFADEDGEDGTILCSEAAIWDVALTGDQVAKIGTATTPPVGVLNRPVSGSNSDLGQNYPNPFSVSTSFPYEINKTGNVSFRILDLAGREIRSINEGIKAPGKYKVEVSSNKLNSGIYYFQMNSNEQTSIRKMIVVR